MSTKNYQIKKQEKPEYRFITKFCILPYTIRSKTHWLKTVHIKQLKSHWHYKSAIDTVCCGTYEYDYEQWDDAQFVYPELCKHKWVITGWYYTGCDCYSDEVCKYKCTECGGTDEQLTI